MSHNPSSAEQEGFEHSPITSTGKCGRWSEFFLPFRWDGRTVRGPQIRLPHDTELDPIQDRVVMDRPGMGGPLPQ